MSDLYIENRTLGKCMIICFFKDLAIVELPNNYEKYVVTIGLSIKNNSWRQGYYFVDFEHAVDVFKNLVKEFYMLNVKI